MWRKSILNSKSIPDRRSKHTYWIMQKILFSTPMQIEHVRIGREFSYYIRTIIDKLFPTSNILLKMRE